MGFLKTVLSVRSIWLGVALVPCMVSAGLSWRTPTTKPVPTKDAKRPSLAFDQYAVNLGKISPMQLAKAWFRFTNFGDSKATITKITPSCGCLNPHLPQREFAPGESGHFVVQVATAGEMPGPREYTITLDYLDPEPRQEILTFRMELPPKQVYLSPRALLVYQFSDQPTTREVLVTDNRDGVLSITGVECGDSFLSAKIGTESVDDEGTRRFPIEVTISAMPPGSHHSHVKIFTNDPKFPLLTVPVKVERQAGPLKVGRSPEE